jgi:hypothetical protein
MGFSTLRSVLGERDGGGWRTRRAVLSYSDFRPSLQMRVFAADTVKAHRMEVVMGKYILGWLLGVPVVVLVIIYLLFN